MGSMGELAEVNGFIASSRAVGDEGTLAGLVGAISRDMGFDYFSLVQFDLARDPGGRGLISISSYPSSWLEEVQCERLYEADPAYLASCRTSVGFRWADIGSIIPLGARQREILRRSKRAGLGDGFTVPAHIPGESSGLATFVVRTGRSLPERRLSMAQLVGAFGYEAARRLRRIGQAAATPTPLTPRQVDCVLLIARGKSDWEISRILGIAEDTVTEHVDGARRRYGVARRSQLVVRALYDGWFSLGEAVGR
jgi:LuxR family quorum-sensing system transcriptional regulator CciR